MIHDNCPTFPGYLSLSLSLSLFHKWYIQMWIQLLANNFQILLLIGCPVPGSFSVTAANLIMRISVAVKRRSAYNLTRSHAPPSPHDIIDLATQPHLLPSAAHSLYWPSYRAAYNFVMHFDFGNCHLRFAICNFDFDLCEFVRWFRALCFVIFGIKYTPRWQRSICVRLSNISWSISRTFRALRKQKLPKLLTAERQMENGKGAAEMRSCKWKWNWKSGTTNIWKTTRFELCFLSNVLHNLLWNYRANEVRASRC